MSSAQFYKVPFKIQLSLFCIVLSFLVSVSLYGQDSNDRLVIDELQKEVKRSKDLKNKSMIISDICLYYQVKDYQSDSVIHYGNKLLQLGEAENFPIASVLGHRRLGSQYMRITMYKEAKYHLYQSIDLAKKHNYLLAIFDSYNPLALNYFYQNKLDSALHYFHKCIESTPKDLHSKLVYSNIGLADVYGNLGDFLKKEKHILIALSESKSAKIKLDQIVALSSAIYFYSLDRPNAVNFNKQKKEYDALLASFGSFRNSFHNNFLFLDSLSFSERIKFLEESLADNTEKGYLDGVFYNYIALQKSYLEEEQFKNAVQVSEEAMAFYTDDHPVRLEVLIEIYRNKWLAESENNPEKAIETVKEYYHLKDSLIEANNSKHISELNIKYETAKKDAQLSKIAFKADRSTIQRNYAILLSGLLLTFGYYLWRRSKYKQQEIEAKNKLQEEQIENLEKERKILSLTSMIEGQEAERTRIAQDLHDGLGGLLSSVRNHFSLIQDEMTKLDKLDVYGRTNSMIDQACKEVRRISHNLMPASLQLNGLVSTISQYCNDIEASHNIEVHFEHTGLEDYRLDESKEIFLYRIIQEGITNVLKHAKASHLLVQLAMYKNEITLIIEDDGNGFDIADKKDGIGLKSISSRVDHLKGHLDIDSKINRGTTITINIPHE